MRSIQRRFEIAKQKSPYLGDFINLMRAVKGQHFSKETMSFWFSKLVDKEDYDSKDKRCLIKELVKLTNMPDEANI